MFPILHAYKLRLTNLSQGNRSLKLASLSARKELDLAEAGYINKLSTEEILSKIVSAKGVDLIRTLNPRDEKTNVLDRKLNKLFREVSMLHAETGAYDLFLGYPFVEGKFLDNNIARCPVVLFPVRLSRDFQGAARWRLSIPEGEPATLNKTFFLALEKFMQIRLPKEFWEEELDTAEDLQSMLNQLYALFTRYELPLNFNSELFRFKVAAFEPKNAAQLDSLPVGELKFHPFAVLGIFPQSDSALIQDYEVIERNTGMFDLEKWLKPQPEVENPKPPSEEFRFFVTPVDQSQEEALLAARAGKSVVVHGPPGTGKSQVILNLVADALANGQRVLVCSQKRAALDVVFNRLMQLGLGDHAALVHDFRTDRAKIFHLLAKRISELEDARTKANDVTLDKWFRDFRLDARRLDEHNAYFDNLYRALTTPSRFGLSVHQLYILADFQTQSLKTTHLSGSLEYAQLRESLEFLKGLRGYLSLFNPEHPWSIRKSFGTYGLDYKPKLLEFLVGLPETLISLEDAWYPCKATGWNPHQVEAIGASIQDWDALAEHFSKEEVRILCGLALLPKQSKDFIDKTLKKAEWHSKRLKGCLFLDDLRWDAHEELAAKIADYERASGQVFRFLRRSWLKSRKALSSIFKRKNQAWSHSNHLRLLEEMKWWEEYRQFVAGLDEIPFFGGLPRDAPWKTISAWTRPRLSAAQAMKTAKSYKGPTALSPLLDNGTFSNTQWEEAKKTIGFVQRYLAIRTSSVAAWETWLHPDQIVKLFAAEPTGSDENGYATDLLVAADRDFELLRDLDAFVHAWDHPTQELYQVLKHALGGISGKSGLIDLLKRLENSVFQDWIAILERENPLLVETTSPRMADRRDGYRELVINRQSCAVELIRARLQRMVAETESYNRLGNPTTYREIARQVQKQRRLWPLRKLVQTFWGEGLDNLLPCWLGSPESVAAIFPMDGPRFDLVIFDEASQCYVERALPVALRGKTVVVAGDEKQLPPYDLYAIKHDDAEEAFLENELAMEVESILDLAKGVFPEVLLRWHYRSQEESLIRFSNQHFYDGRLMVMPPAHRRPELQPPVEFVEVSGTWDQNRNLQEAEAAILMVEKTIQLDSSLSIGIVTFNFQQMELIQDMVERRFQQVQQGQDDALKKKWAAVMDFDGQGGGMFVKNIENVQGDERDVIIFSIGYAPNLSGKLVAQFGLLNQRGGENRLNVAITRARKKVVILCSFNPNQLAVEESLHPGPKLLKKYLLDAWNSQPGLDAPDLASPAPNETQLSLPADLAARLRSIGLIVEQNVGGTAYRIDLVVKTKDGKGCVAVECEGPVYFSGRSAKEREVYRRRLLEDAGWQSVRVWSRAYYLNPDGVVAEILSHLRIK